MNTKRKQAHKTASPFVAVDERAVDWIIEHGLTKAESKVFFYFLKLDRFGDRPVSVKNSEVILALGIGRTAYYAAIAKFQELGWFDIHFKGEIAVSNQIGPCSENSENVSEKANQVSGKTDSVFGIPDSVSGKTDGVSGKTEALYIDRARIQTNSDLTDYSYSSESESVVGDSEGGASETGSEPEQILPPVNSEKPETAEDLQPPSSATPPSSVVAFEAQMRGENLHPWELSPKRFDYDPGFVRFLLASYLPTLHCYKTQAPTIDKAQQWLNSARYNEERKDVAWLQWEKYQASLLVQDEPVCHPFREFRPVQPTETVSLAQYAAQFRQRLVGGGE